MAHRITVKRNAGHPGDKRSGYDQALVEADTLEDMDAAVVEATQKFWKPWIVGHFAGTGKPGAVFYKPCGANSLWAEAAPVQIEAAPVATKPKRKR